MTAQTGLKGARRDAISTPLTDAQQGRLRAAIDDGTISQREISDRFGKSFKLLKRDLLLWEKEQS